MYAVFFIKSNSAHSLFSFHGQYAMDQVINILVFIVHVILNRYLSGEWNDLYLKVSYEYWMVLVLKIYFYL